MGFSKQSENPRGCSKPHGKHFIEMVCVAKKTIKNEGDA